MNPPWYFRLADWMAENGRRMVGDPKPAHDPADDMLCMSILLDGSGALCLHPRGCNCHGPMFGCPGFLPQVAHEDAK